MPFFIRNQSKRNLKPKPGAKRKTSNQGRHPRDKKKQKFSAKPSGEEIPSDSEIDSDAEVGPEKEYTSSEEEEETAQEKRLRLAKQYLAQLEEEAGSDEEGSKDAVADRLKRDLLEQSGKLWKEVASDYVEPSLADIQVLRGHNLSITCVVITPDNRHVFSGSKDCSIIKWSIETCRKVHIIPGGRKGTEKNHIGHTSHILAMAISSDGKYLASGDQMKLIHIWNPETCVLLHTFTGHRDAVSGLAFQKGTHQLFSASHDRAVKIWNLNEMGYVETLFGHQDKITDIDSLTRERAITSGGRDGSLRIWKIIEESQLIFHGHSGSIDCVALINEEHFVSGADNNTLCLWSVMKKKPLLTVSNAHRGDNSENVIESKENWITSVRSLQSTDLIVSGSKDGCIRFWKCAKNFRQLTPVFSVPVPGFVNSLQFSQDGRYLVAGVGQEHKLGRWWRLKEAKNSVYIIRLSKSS